jgi:membrane-bound lytic murein transglycosylase MltF
MDTSKFKGNVSPKTIKNYSTVENSINYASDEYSVPRWLLKSMLFIESRFDNNRRSHTGVTGIAMITRTTARHFGISKATVESQIRGMAKILRHHFNNLPNNYSKYEKWKLSAYIYNRGKKSYFEAKKHVISTRKVVNYQTLISQLIKTRGSKEGIQYIKSIIKTKPMFE